MEQEQVMKILTAVTFIYLLLVYPASQCFIHMMGGF